MEREITWTINPNEWLAFHPDQNNQAPQKRNKDQGGDPDYICVILFKINLLPDA